MPPNVEIITLPKLHYPKNLLYKKIHTTVRDLYFSYWFWQSAHSCLFSILDNYTMLATRCRAHQEHEYYIILYFCRQFTMLHQQPLYLYYLIFPRMRSESFVRKNKLQWRRHVNFSAKKYTIHNTVRIITKCFYDEIKSLLHYLNSKINGQ